MATVSDSERTTLSAVASDGTVSLPEIVELIDHSKSTVTRHVNHFEEQGSVETWTEGRTK